MVLNYSTNNHMRKTVKANSNVPIGFSSSINVSSELSNVPLLNVPSTNIKSVFAPNYISAITTFGFGTPTFSLMDGH